MKFLGSLFVGKPLTIGVVAAVFIALYLIQRFMTVGARCHSSGPLAAAVAWVVYAAWEWLILVRTPEANIRVDLLVIWPVLAILSVWAVFRVFR